MEIVAASVVDKVTSVLAMTFSNSDYSRVSTPLACHAAVMGFGSSELGIVDSGFRRFSKRILQQNNLVESWPGAPSMLPQITLCVSEITHEIFLFR